MKELSGKFKTDWRNQLQNFIKNKIDFLLFHHVKNTFEFISDNYNYFGKNKSIIKNREYDRHKINQSAQMLIKDRNILIKGVIHDVSQYGLLFRPSSLYIQHRSGDRVQIEYANHALAGNIRSTSPRGYGIRTDDQIDVSHFEIGRQ